jgi:hypothetical protein
LGPEEPQIDESGFLKEKEMEKIPEIQHETGTNFYPAQNPLTIQNTIQPGPNAIKHLQQ